jgi:uncharacterized protein YkwD
VAKLKRVAFEMTNRVEHGFEREVIMGRLTNGFKKSVFVCCLLCGFALVTNLSLAVVSDGEESVRDRVIEISAVGNPDDLLRSSGYAKPTTATTSEPQLVMKRTASLFSHGNPTDYEQLTLELINHARSDPAGEAARLGISLNEDLSPGTISQAPKAPVAFHSLLINASRSHSQWMLDNDVFSHTGIGGSSAGDRMSAAGYVFSGSWTWAENIAWGGTTGALDIESQTRANHDNLFLSSGHRVNMLGGTDEVGVGVRSGVFTYNAVDYNAVMVTQNYAKSDATSGPLLLGVAYNDSNQDGDYDPGEGVNNVQVSITGAAWYAMTSASGGYAVPYADQAGTMQVVFSGGDLAGAVTQLVQRTGENVKLDLANGATGWDTGCLDLGGGWRRLDGFGDYVPTGNGWYWHNIHGYFYPSDASIPTSIFVYTMDMGWLYTRITLWPYFYRFSDSCWLWYLPDSSNPRWFNNLTDGVWESRN